MGGEATEKENSQKTKGGGVLGLAWSEIRKRAKLCSGRRYVRTVKLCMRGDSSILLKSGTLLRQVEREGGVS